MAYSKVPVNLRAGLKKFQIYDQGSVAKSFTIVLIMLFHRQQVFSLRSLDEYILNIASQKIQV